MISSRFVFLCLVSFFAFISYEWARTPLTPLLARNLGGSPEIIGTIMAASTAVGIFVKLPAGVLSDAIGKRWVLLCGICFFAFTPFLYSFAVTPGALLAIRVIHGFSTAVFGPVALASVADLFKGRRAEGIGWYTACIQTGKSIGPALGGVTLGLAGFAGSYMLCGISGLIAFGLLIAYLRQAARDDVGMETGKAPGLESGRFVHEVQRRLGGGLRELVTSPRVLTVAIAQAVQLFALGALQAFLPLYGVSKGHGPKAVGFFFGVQSVASLLSRPVVGRLSDRFGRLRMIVTGLILSAITFYALPFSQSLPALYALAFVYGIGEAVTHTSTSAQVADLCRAYSLGSAMGLLGSVGDVGHASGQFFTGVLVSRLQFTGAYHSVAGLLVVTAAILMWTFMRTESISLREGES